MHRMHGYIGRDMLFIVPSYIGLIVGCRWQVSIIVFATGKSRDEVCHGHFNVQLHHVRHRMKLYVHDLVGERHETD